MATKKKKPAAKSGKAFPRSKSSSGGSSRSAEPKPAPAPAAPEHTEADPERPVFERHNNNQARSIILFAVAILIFLLSIIQGTSGWLALHKGLKSFFGVSLLLLPWLLMYLAVTDDKDPQSTEFGKRLFSVFGVVMLFSVFVEILFGGGRLQDLSFGESVALLSDEGMKWSGGGMIAILAYALQRFLGDVGSKIIIILSMFVSVMLMTRTRLTVFLDKVTAPFRRIAAIFREDAQDGAIIAEYEEEEDSVRDYAQQAAMDTYGENGMNYPSSPQEPQFLMDIPLDEMPADPMADTIDLPLPEIREEARKAADPAEDAELEELSWKLPMKSRSRRARTADPTRCRELISSIPARAMPMTPAQAVNCVKRRICSRRCSRASMSRRVSSILHAARPLPATRYSRQPASRSRASRALPMILP